MGTSGQTTATPPRKRGSAEWGLWANEQAVASSIILFFGGILGVAGAFDNWHFAASVIPASFILFLIEWPRGCRFSGKSTTKRRFQEPLTSAVKTIWPLANYYVRAVLLLIVSVPCCFLLPTIIGGFCLIISSALYVAAAINGERWKPIPRTEKPVSNSFPMPPTSPPPRNPEVQYRYAPSPNNFEIQMKY